MAKEMTPKEAEIVLGLSGYYTDEDISIAYKQKIRENHPDLQPKDELSQKAASKKMAEINKAKKVLRTYLGNREKDTRPYIPPPSVVETTRPADTFSYDPGTFDPDMTSWDTSSKNQTEIPFSPMPSQSNWSWVDQYGEPPKEEDDSEEDSEFEDIHNEEPKKRTTAYSVVRTIIGKFPLRLAMVLLAIGLLQWRVGLNVLVGFSGVDGSIPLSGEKAVFYVGFLLVSIANLFAGWLTNRFRESLLWAWDKINHVAPPEPSMRYAIFGHLPYRLMFLLFAVWNYCDFALYHVDGSGPFDWPSRLLLFAVAAFNFLFPIITNFIRTLLAGSED